jgi:uncharacterized protein (DUF983 family)
MAAENIDAPLRRVKHAELERFQNHSPFKSKCPACGRDGLFVRREQYTFRLAAIDRCIYCGQAFEYEDIEEMQRDLDGDANRK